MILFRLLVLNTLNHVVVSDHDAHYEIATLILSKRNSSKRNTHIIKKELIKKEHSYYQKEHSYY